VRSLKHFCGQEETQNVKIYENAIHLLHTITADTESDNSKYSSSNPATLAELAQRVERIPDTFELVTPNRTVFHHLECSVRFNEDKKWRHSCILSLFNDILFVRSVHKKFGRKSKDLFEAVFSLSGAKATEETEGSNNTIRITCGGDNIYITDISSGSDIIKTFENVVKNLESSPPSDIKNIIIPYDSKYHNPLKKTNSTRLSDFARTPTKLLLPGPEKKKGSQSARKEHNFIPISRKDSDSSREGKDSGTDRDNTNIVTPRANSKTPKEEEKYTKLKKKLSFPDQNSTIDTEEKKLNNL